MTKLVGIDCHGFPDKSELSWEADFILYLPGWRMTARVADLGTVSLSPLVLSKTALAWQMEWCSLWSLLRGLPFLVPHWVSKVATVMHFRFIWFPHCNIFMELPANNILLMPQGGVTATILWSDWSYTITCFGKDLVKKKRALGSLWFSDFYLCNFPQT